MKKTLLIVGGIAVLGVIAITAWVLRPSAEPTAPIEAIPLATRTAESIAVDIVNTPKAVEPTTETASGAYPPPAEQSENPEAAPEAAYPAPGDTGSENAAPAGVVLFQIVQAESEARFTLTEELRGAPTTVIGKTDQVAGEISIDFGNPANSQVGIIQVNARTLATNNNNRNRMIRNEILDTGAYEFITFTPKAITGLPAGVAEGDTITFQITGDLTIRDVTQEVTFDVTATLVSAEQLEGLASTTVTRGAYSLTIPSVPNVANVSDEVLIELAFVAASQP